MRMQGFNSHDGMMTVFCSTELNVAVVHNDSMVEDVGRRMMGMGVGTKAIFDVIHPLEVMCELSREGG